ncbi:MAG TPA: PEP-CTERM sorting domain-containing protein [Opitutus sp.]|nr:PEP-CTERM sorting domain-containing protein [Opitutus sp.]
MPEPSTYAFGAMLLVAGAVVLRRRRALSVASAAA